MSESDVEFFQKAFQAYCLSEIHLHHMVNTSKYSVKERIIVMVIVILIIIRLIIIIIIITRIIIVIMMIIIIMLLVFQT